VTVTHHFIKRVGWNLIGVVAVIGAFRWTVLRHENARFEAIALDYCRFVQLRTSRWPVPVDLSAHTSSLYLISETELRADG